MGLRRAPDGGFWLTKHDKDIERQLNASMSKIGNRWYPVSFSAPLESLRDSYSGKVAHIIGKGPSIGRLRITDFGDGPIICVNQSIYYIESLGETLPTFVIQSDVGLEEKCRPQHATLLLSEEAKGWYADIKKKVLYNVRKDFKEQLGQPTAVYAFHFAKLMGCVGVKLHGFDSVSSRITTYYEEFGDVGKRPSEKFPGERFLKHAEVFKKTAARLNLKMEIA